jgi:hypothetical protein
MGTLPGVSMRRVCRVLGFSRARLRARAALAALPPRLDEALVGRIQQLIERHPTFGYRRLWALLRYAEGIPVNRKAVYRVLKLKGWLVHQRTVTPRPRVQGLKSRWVVRTETQGSYFEQCSALYESPTKPMDVALISGLQPLCGAVIHSPCPAV